MTVSLQNVFSAPITTPEQYDELVAKHCLPESVEQIEDIDLDSRFDDLSKDEVQTLTAWFQENGALALIRIDSLEMALHLLGTDADGVDPSSTPYNYIRGKGKNKTYHWCSRNLHNRNEKTSNLGDIQKGGLAYDLFNGFYVPGPQAVIDCSGVILSFQHRIKAAIKVADETDTFPTMDTLVLVGFPTPLAGVLDRGARKTDSDQEVMDTRQFKVEFLKTILDEDCPENVSKLRNDLSKILVTVRSNLWSRFHGTGYHPSGANSPTDRQARTLQKCFSASSVDSNHDALQELIVRVWGHAQESLWKTNLSPAMVTTAIVLASNADQDSSWKPVDGIDIDETVVERVFSALGVVSAEGEEGLSKYNREIAKVRKDPKKPTGLDRWIFWGLVPAIADLIENGELGDEKYFPAVNARFMEKVRKGKVQPPVFGGYDSPKVDESDDDSDD